MSAVLATREPSARYLGDLQPPLAQNLDLVAQGNSGIERLRALILTLAIKGRLVPQDPREVPAVQLVERIREEKSKLGVLIAGGRDERRGASVGTDDLSRLPCGWIWTTLGEIGQINPRVAADDDVIASFVPMSAVPIAFVDTHTFEARPWGGIRSGFTHFAEGDVGVAKITPCFENGKSTVFSGLCGGIGAGTTELHVVRPLGGIEPRYILAFLKSPDFLRAGELVMTGSAGQKRLPRAYFETRPLPLPPLAEQARIVARVEELMRLCDALEAKGRLEAEQHDRLLRALLDSLTDSASPEELAANWQRVAEHFDLLLDRPEAVDVLEQTILKLATRGLLCQQDRHDEPANVQLARTAELRDRNFPVGRTTTGDSAGDSSDKEVEPYRLPAGWQWAKFRDYILELCTGPFGSLIHKDDYLPGGVPLVNPSHMLNGRIRPDSRVAVSAALAGELGAYRLSAGDVLLARRGEVGRYALVTHIEDGWLCGTGSFFVRLAPFCNREYFGLMLEDPRFRAHLLGESVGTTMTNLNQKILLDAPIAVPPLGNR